MKRKSSFLKRMGLTAAMVAAAIMISTTCGAVINDAGILNNQGVELYERGYTIASVEKFQQALQFDPHNPEIHANLGYAYQALGNHQEAVREFKTALSYNPNDLEAHNNLGVSLYNLGMVDRAIEEWEFVLSNDPTHAAASANIAMVRNPMLAEQIASEAQDAMMSPVQKQLKQQRNLEELFNKGKTAFLEARYDEAIDYLTDVLQQKPNSKFSHFYLGMSYAYLNMDSSAMTHLREYMIQEDYPPESPPSYDKAMEIFNMLKKGGTVQPRLRKGNIRASALFEQGKQAYQQQNYFKAVQILSEVHRSEPNSYPTNYYLGLAYRQVGDINKAVYHLTKCLLAGPEYRTKQEALKIASIVKQLTDQRQEE